MKIWLSKSSEISIRQQLATQILLGIASGDLEVGEKLPSTSELARRFKIHANTVSAAYQQLADESLIEFRQGSGFYVRENSNSHGEDFALDRLIADFLNETRKKGFKTAEVRRHIENWFKSEPPNHFLIVEENAALREILTDEIKTSVSWTVKSCSFTDFERSRREENAVFLALADETEKLSRLLPPQRSRVFLKIRSVSGTLTGEQRPPDDALIAVVSGWRDFLHLAKMLLVAAQIDTDSIILRSTAEESWQRGLNEASLIICDTVAARHFADDKRARPFHLIADETLAELKDLIV